MTACVTSAWSIAIFVGTFFASVFAASYFTRARKMVAESHRNAERAIRLRSE